ncbi:DNA-(apurinic or apyrimidinic site) lyase 2 [Gonapodya sp. JEL0774]|nr:DNA-(apurinic or apyrimidinic site) lyase 2 [Gonapodya sp. JEL0774]
MYPAITTLTDLPTMFGTPKRVSHPDDASFLVEGFRTMRGYAPWNECRSYKELLDSLGADIFCFQEMKVTWEKLDSDIALIPGYDAFFSVSRGKSGYSGVATYVCTDRIPTPLDAEEGFTGLLARPGTLSRIGCYGDLELEFDRDELVHLDSEGRCLITDHGDPSDNDSGREEFKIKFHRGIELRARALIDAGRQVIVLGDVNITYMPIDHYNPMCSYFQGPIEEDSYRFWLHNFLTPRGPVVDLFRHFHPDAQGAYTCWNTKKDGRSGNFGTRIDYILPTRQLLPWFEECTIEANIRGSDHCPVVATLRSSIQSGTDHVLLNDLLSPPLRDSEGNLVTREPSKLCSRFFDKFSSKQQTLKSFLVQKSSQTPMDTEVKATDSDASAANVTASGGAKTSANVKISRPLSASAPGPPPKKAKTTLAGQQSLLSFFQPPVPAPTVLVSAGAEVGFKSTSSAPERLANKPSRKNGASVTRTLSKGTTAPSAFSRPANPSPAPPAPPSPNLKASYGQSVEEELSPVNGTDQPRQSQTCCLSLETESIPDVSDVLDAATVGDDEEPPGTADWNGSRSSGLAHQSAAWGAIFTRPTPPTCRHGEPAKLYTVTKKGANQGRQFWMCPRPGPTNMSKIIGVDKTERDNFK